MVSGERDDEEATVRATLALRYRLVAQGWSVTTVGDGTRRATLRASYHSDALGDLARAVLALRRGAGYATCSWLEEPGEYRWHFHRHGRVVQLIVVWFDDWEEYRDAHDYGRVLLVMRCPLHALVEQVWRQLDALRQSLGAEGYWRRWERHAFPYAEYARLRHAVATAARCQAPFAVLRYPGRENYCCTRYGRTDAGRRPYPPR